MANYSYHFAEGGSMSDDTEVKPMGPEDVPQSTNSRHWTPTAVRQLRAIADGRHAVYDTATHEAVECRELDAMRETIKAQDALLDERKAELERLRERDSLLSQINMRAVPDYATAKNTASVRNGYEVGGYVRFYRVSPYLIHAIDAAQQEQGQ